MPRRCVVAGCDGEAVTKVRSIHLFPTATPSTPGSVRQQWVKFVQVWRVGWQPTTTSMICSDHFTPDDFTNWHQFTAGFASKLLMKDAAVPSVQPPKERIQARQLQQRGLTGEQKTGKPKETVARPRKAVAKLDIARSLACMPPPGPVDREVPDTDILEETLSPIGFDEPTGHIQEEITGDGSFTANGSFTASTQCDFKPWLRTREIQVDVKVKKIEVGTQCSLLEAPPLQLLSNQEPVVDDVTEQEPMDMEDETRLDPNWEPTSDDEDDEDDEAVPEFTSCPEHPETEHKFIVFHSNLLALFDKCENCREPTEAVIKSRIGTFIRVEQETPYSPDDQNVSDLNQ